MQAYQYIIKKRYYETPAVRIRGTADATNYFNALFFDDTVENFIILALDRDNWCIGDKILAIGTHDCVVVSPRDVIYAAGCFHAAALVMAHNHPEGGRKPSEADQKLEREIRTAAERINLKIHEQIILVPEEPQPPPTPWTEDETDKLRDLLAANTPLESLTDELTRSLAEIKAKAEKMLWLLPGQKLYL